MCALCRYSCICVPPLPDKTFNPKFGETADVKRREKLQRWLRRIMRHPVLRQVSLCACVSVSVSVSVSGPASVFRCVCLCALELARDRRLPIEYCDAACDVVLLS